MKFNLKKRLKPKFVMGMFYHAKDVNEWFDGFEKELRKRFEQAKIINEEEYDETHLYEDLLKEILGE